MKGKWMSEHCLQILRSIETAALYGLQIYTLTIIDIAIVFTIPEDFLTFCTFECFKDYLHFRRIFLHIRVFNTTLRSHEPFDFIHYIRGYFPNNNIFIFDSGYPFELFSICMTVE
ncbi:hypothetical protein BDA99DRAFT_576050 [Phascolomyces articulosus]|uniref:Uncharacterized protein n=1 Tax=Phascolomyces articulosus TaxID=60185 RepID=A0AAD5PAD6_9FUNG|nr:hypothetical protein BDA99DRAFT_576050 [Phascolomyces articulosus]